MKLIRTLLSYGLLFLILGWGIYKSGHNFLDVSADLRTFIAAPIEGLNRIQISDISKSIPDDFFVVTETWKKILPQENNFFLSPGMMKDPYISQKSIEVPFPKRYVKDARCGFMYVHEALENNDQQKILFTEGHYKIVCID